MKVPLYINDKKAQMEVELFTCGQRIAIQIPAGQPMPKAFKESTLSLHLSVEQWKLLAEAAASRGGGL